MRALCLGDCVVLHQPEVADLDDRVIAAAVDLRDGGRAPHIRSAVADLAPQLRAHRALMNTEDGYWIAEPSGAGISHAQTAAFERGQVASAMLMTDGMSAIAELTGLSRSWEELAGRLASGDALSLMSDHAELLDQDPDFDRFPRLKHRDDMTFLSGRLA